jgi:hypothetical protein
MRNLKMTGLTIKEDVGGSEIEYKIEKNGDHSGVISVSMAGNILVDKLGFSTTRELTNALVRAEITALTRINTDSIVRSSMASPASQDFIKNSIKYLRELGNQIGGRPNA